jgi:hypothetical protein
MRAAWEQKGPAFNEEWYVDLGKNRTKPRVMGCEILGPSL